MAAINCVLVVFDFRKLSAVELKWYRDQSEVTRDLSCRILTFIISELASCGEMAYLKHS